MKILHTGDWHLGAYVGPQCDDPLKRMGNTMRCLDKLVETARQEHPDIILVAGDIFHTAKVWADRALTEVRLAAKYINLLSQFAPIAILYGTPNHDGEGQFTTLQEMTPGITYFTEPGLKTILTKSGFIQIAGLPGFDKGHFRAQFPGLSAEEENQIFTQQLALVVQGLSAQIDPAIPSVLMAHHTVVGCELDNGTHVFQANEVVLDATTLDSSNFDLVCLGHIHKAQRVDACSKPVYYAGSIDSFTFNDEEHLKGFYIHYINDPVMGHGTSHNFRETPAREFFTLRLSQEDIEFQSWIGRSYPDMVVRALYTCDSETEKALDKKKLEQDLYASGAYYVSEIRPEKVTAVVNRERMTEKLTVSDCLERYFKGKGKSETEISQLTCEAVDIVAEASANSPIGTTSGLFLPVEIEVRNYRSYAEEKLSFEDIFFAMVNGKNGSGKSSLFMDAITDCLYEETREKELTGWIRNGEKSGSISFTFRLGSDTWRVTRTRQRSGKATLALAKEECYGGLGWDDHSCERMTDTQQKIVDLLGMDCDTFQSCVLIMQDRYGKFMEASKEDRMNVLASLLGLGIYDELEKLAKEKLTEVNRSIKALKADIEKLEGDVFTEEDLRMEGSQVEAQLSVANNDLKTAREELAGYQAQLAAMEGYTREIETLQQEVRQKTEQYSEKKSKKDDLERRVFETESFLQGEQNVLDKCAELDSTRLQIASMEGKMTLLADKQTQCGKVNRELVAVKAHRNNIYARLQAFKESMKDRQSLEAFVSSNTSEADLERQELNSQQYNEANNEALRLQMEKNNTERSGQAELREIEQRLEMLKQKTLMLNDANCIDIENAKCRFLKDAIGAKAEVDELETKLIAKGIAIKIDIEEASNKLQEALNKRNSIRYYKFEHDEVIREVKRFREAKDKLAKLAADSATADALSNQDLELGEREIELESSLANLTFEIEALEQETSQWLTLHARIKELLQHENLKAQLPKARQFVESSREQIEQLEADIISLSEEIGKQNNRLAELQGLTGNRELYKQCIRADEQEIKAIEGRVSALNQQIGNINAKLEVIDGQRKQLQHRQTELQQSARQAAQMQVLVEAFSQDGIPYQIIREIVPELEAAANEILGQMTGGKMRLEFVTEKVLKSNKAKEVATLEIIIIDVDNGVLPYLSRSGGQKVRAALAVNFALANIKASRVGLQLGMMFVDEPPFLDADGVEAYCAALETIHSKYPEMKLLAISHDENMKSMFPQQLYVEVTESGSRVRRL